MRKKQQNLDEKEQDLSDTEDQARLQSKQARFAQVKEQVRRQSSGSMVSKQSNRST
jgi:hypothetical protein